MGFLLGAFGKLSAGSRYRQLQGQMMRIQARARRATRDVANMTKMLDRQEKAMLNNVTMQSNYLMSSSQSGLWSAVMGKFAGVENMTDDQKKDYEKSMNDFNQQMTNMKAMNEMQASAYKQQITDYFEMLRETQLEPLKDEEDSLQLEKESLESQVQLAKMDYDACKEMEKSDAQMLKPSYTGAG